MPSFFRPFNHGYNVRHSSLAFNHPICRAFPSAHLLHVYSRPGPTWVFCAQDVDLGTENLDTLVELV